MIKRYILLFLVCCLVFLLITFNEPKGLYYYFGMLLFSVGISLKVYTTTPKPRQR